MPEIYDPVPPQNPRVAFMVRHRVDLELWSVIPFNLGMAAAPLYDHLPGSQLAAIIVAILAGSWLWIWWLRPHIERRIVLFRANSGASRNFNKRPWALRARVLAALLFVVAMVIFLNRDKHVYRPNGWVERSSGTWLCMTLIYCLYRALDRTNYPPRRLWYGIAALVFAVGFYFLNLSPGSFAVILVLNGATGIVLGLLDLGLLFHFASTFAADGPEGRNTGAIDEDDMHG